MMSNQEEEDIFAEAEEGKVDMLQLELHKEEKKTKAPMPMSRLIVIFACILVVSAGLAIGIAKIIDANSSDDLRNFSEWIVIMLMVLGGGAIFAASITGVWGGQRNIPIRMVSPSNSSVVGKGVMITGYVIEECMDNERFMERIKRSSMKSLCQLKRMVCFIQRLLNLLRARKSQSIYSLKSGWFH